MTTLPDSARFALWFTAWCAGATSLDETRDAIVGHDAAHSLSGHQVTDGTTPLILGLGELRRQGASGAGVALPVPGDPLGLAGPAQFTALAMEHEEAVILSGADLGAVPVRTGAAITWQVVPAVSSRQIPDLPEADTLLRQELIAAADRLAELEVARWRPEVADELMALRQPHDLVLPPGTSDRASRVLGLAARCRTIVELALQDDGGAISAHQMQQRQAALIPLERAARRALVAACQYAHER